MDRKAASTLAIILLLLSAAAVCVQSDPDIEVSGSSVGTSSNPRMLSSDLVHCRVLYEDGQMTMYFGINKSSFIDPSIAIMSWVCSDVDDFKGADHSVGVKYIEPDSDHSSCEYDTGISASVSKIDESNDSGLYALTLAVLSNPDYGPHYYKFKLLVTEKIVSKEKTQAFYYGVYLRVVDEAYVNVEGQDVTSEDSPMVIKPDTEYRIAAYDGSGEYLGGDYAYYAEGLPDGFNLRSDGVLEGKASVSVDSTGMATLYAVSKNDATEIHSGELYYSVYFVNPFEYRVNGAGWISASDDGFVAVGNSDALKIEIREPDPSVQGSYSATLTMGGDLVTYGVNQGVIWLNVQDDPETPSFKDYTGIVQLRIARTIEGNIDCDSILHIMLVGPVVHSGLDPTVSSF
jgi:hypothetical protein